MGEVQELPPSLRQQAEDWLAGPQQPATPRDAATVLIVRDGERDDTHDGTPGAEQGLEVLMLQRVASMAFAPGMTVYPGGRVDPRDSADAGELRWCGPGAQWWAEELRCTPELAQALVCAAVRETFEECGVLLAGPDESSVVSDTATPDWEEQRLALLDRRVSLRELLAERGLALRADLLRPRAHWITPEFEPRRYDTRFFLAALPEGQETRHVGGEADVTRWWRPADALAAVEAGTIAMLPPTIGTLTDLSRAASVAEALALPPVTETFMPCLVRTADGFGLRLESVG